MIPESVIVTNDIQSELTTFFTQNNYQKIAVIVDENTEQHCLPLVLDYLPEHWLIKIKSGEEQKHLGTCTQIWEYLTEAQFGRRDLVINLGGGVIGDMGGFVASTYKRGMDFINLPSTLLSQVDASIGGKLGIDFNGFKNHIGVFQDPKRVIVFPKLIETLSDRELRSGFAEVIKHGLIADAEYWQSVSSSDHKDQSWMEVIHHSIGIKGKVVAEDPRENGLRKILNFGHTLGHAVETYFLETENRLLHGEAIAVGMIMEAFLSHKFAGLSGEALEEISNYLLKIYEPTAIEEKLFDPIIKLTGQDKKNASGKVNYSLLRKIGDCGFDYQPETALVLDSMFYFNSLLK